MAYVLVRTSTAWYPVLTLADPSGTAGDQFGASMAISGSTTVVGADGTNSQTGAAYVFTRSGAIWSQQAELADPGTAAGDLFGLSVAIARSTAVVGAPRSNGGNGAANAFVNV